MGKKAGVLTSTEGMSVARYNTLRTYSTLRTYNTLRRYNTLRTYAVCPQAQHRQKNNEHHVPALRLALCHSARDTNGGVVGVSVPKNPGRGWFRYLTCNPKLISSPPGAERWANQGGGRRV